MREDISLPEGARRADGMKLSRRGFLGRFSLDGFRKRLREAEEAFDEDREEQPGTGFFDSYENGYTLVNEYAYFIEDEVRALGIDTQGKSSLEIAREVYELKGRPPVDSGAGQESGPDRKSKPE